LEGAEVELATLQRGDLPDVVSMMNKIWWRHFPGIISDEQIDYMLSRFYSLEALSEDFERADVEYRFIQCVHGRVGFCSFGPGKAGHYLSLHKLYVLPQFQRRGYGSAALGQLERIGRTRGVRGIVLAVNRNNRGAIRAYREQGFVVRDSVKKDIGGGFFMDDYMMEKSFE
jgi:ribosomal protein S18 acetylase RimI-like enzyme